MVRSCAALKESGKRVKPRAHHRKSMKLEKGGVAAYVINREGFDKLLAKRLDCSVMFKTPLDGFTVLDDRVMVRSGGKTFESLALLGCDGSNSLVRKQMQAKPKETLKGLIAVTGEKDDGEFVEMWFDKKVCDGFLWKIPRGSSVEYGMLGTGAKFEQLRDFFGLKGAGKRHEKRGGIVPLGPPKTYYDRVLLVGDAAVQVKPWSGGGVIYSLKAAEIAANTLRQAKDTGDFSEAFLKMYEQGWKEAFGGRIRAGMLGRAVFRKMNNTQLNLAMRGLKRARFLMNKLDMDYLVKK